MRCKHVTKQLAIKPKLNNKNSVIQFPIANKEIKSPSMGCCKADMIDWRF